MTGGLRRDGRFLRTLLRIGTTIDRSRNDYRSKRVLNLDPTHLVEVNRSGSVQFDPVDGPIPLRLNAIREFSINRKNC